MQKRIDIILFIIGLSILVLSNFMSAGVDETIVGGFGIGLMIGCIMRFMNWMLHVITALIGKVVNRKN